MTARCRVPGCPFGTRLLPWWALAYTCPEHRHRAAQDARWGQRVAEATSTPTTRPRPAQAARLVKPAGWGVGKHGRNGWRWAS